MSTASKAFKMGTRPPCHAPHDCNTPTTAKRKRHCSPDQTHKTKWPSARGASMGFWPCGQPSGVHGALSSTKKVQTISLSLHHYATKAPRSVTTRARSSELDMPPRAVGINAHRRKHATKAWLDMQRASIAICA